MASRRFWIVGGIYTTTKFLQLAPGREPERIGPFARQEEAQTE